MESEADEQIEKVETVVVIVCFNTKQLSGVSLSKSEIFVVWLELNFLQAFPFQLFGIFCSNVPGI